MKTTSIVKTLSLCALISLSSSGLAQADNSSCLLGSSSPSAAARMNTPESSTLAMQRLMEDRMNQQLDRIEQSLRNGQISPAQAGKMMREQWELMQFQRSFMDREPGTGNLSSSGNNSCGLKQDAKELAAKLAPVVGNMAAEGMHTATTVMRAIAREAEKLIREDEAMDQRF